jgi:uncharacterized membrane protein
MAPFLKRLDALLSTARERELISGESSSALMDLAREKERNYGLLSLTAVLGRLGGLVAILGVILVVSANWSEISDATKIAGLLFLLAGSHAAGFWLSMPGRDMAKTAEAMHFIGAGMVLAGIGLIAQIYNLNERPPNGVLLWLIAIVPLAVLLRSPSISLMSIFALLLWAHMEGSFPDSPLLMPRYQFTSHLVLEMNMGAALVGFSPLLRTREPEMAKVFRVVGGVLLFASLYIMTFFRHFSDVKEEGSVILQVGSFALGMAGLFVGRETLAPESSWYRNRLLLLLLLGLVLFLGLAALSADMGWLPRGADLEFFNFGRNQTFDYAAILISLSAWLLWFFLAIWCVGFGTRSGRKGYLNAGVLGVGVGVLTLFFDLIGSLQNTGTIFLLGGVALLVTGWSVERWRRRMLGSMGGSS